MNALTDNQEDLTKPLRHALLGNAAFSLVTGLALLIAAESITLVLGLRRPATLQIIGAVLVSYSSLLALNAWRTPLRAGQAWLAVILDLGWVFGSVILIAADRFSAAGDWLVSLAAVAVFVLAFLQWLGLRTLGCARCLARSESSEH